MRSLVLICLIALLPAGRAPAAQDLLVAHQRVLVLGDSITHGGRYVSFLEYYFHELAPGAGCDLISIGLSGETVSGLSEPGLPYPRSCVLERLDRALTAVKPGVVLAFYGMNDGIYHPPAPERRAAFLAGLHQLREKVAAAGARLVLLTPTVFEPEPLAAKTVPATAAVFGYSAPYVGYDETLADLAHATVEFQQEGVMVVDIHTVMQAAQAGHRARDREFYFTKDGVHPGDPGHLLIAQTLARALGLQIPATADEDELARILRQPVFDLIHARRRLRSEAWLAFVGYSRERPYKSAWVDAAESAAALLQRQIDATTATIPSQIHPGEP